MVTMSPPRKEGPMPVEFDPNGFVLTAFQRIQGGRDSGDRQTAQTFRGLFFRI
jgi:hypothetical protein